MTNEPPIRYEEYKAKFEEMELGWEDSFKIVGQNWCTTLIKAFKTTLLVMLTLGLGFALNSEHSVTETLKDSFIAWTATTNLVLVIVTVYFFVITPKRYSVENKLDINNRLEQEAFYYYTFIDGRSTTMSIVRPLVAVCVYFMATSIVISLGYQIMSNDCETISSDIECHKQAMKPVKPLFEPETNTLHD